MRYFFHSFGLSCLGGSIFLSIGFVGVLQMGILWQWNKTPQYPPPKWHLQVSRQSIFFTYTYGWYAQFSKMWFLLLWLFKA